MITDKLSKANNGVLALPTKLASNKSTSDTSAELEASTGWPQDATDGPVHFALFKTDPEDETQVAEGTLSFWKATLNGVSLSNMEHRGGPIISYSIGDSVLVTSTPGFINDLIDGLLTSHTRTGALKTQAVKDALGITGTTPPDYTILPYTPNSVTNNGNRATTFGFTGVDLSTTLTRGTRLRVTRASAATTQCLALNGVNQYMVKTGTINKLAFTNNFVISAWIKASDYSVNCIVSRTNGSSGFIFDVNAFGQVGLFGYNGGSGNNSGVRSYQAIPLNKWVHVTAQLDMSSFSATPTTSYVMIDGVDVPAFVSRVGTNPTSLVQAGNLEIGGLNGGQDPFNGKIAQVIICNAKVSQSTIRGYMNQPLSGGETAVASAYSFNGVATDLNTPSANDLVAQNGASVVAADSPFGGQSNGSINSTVDYAIVQDVSVSSGNTTVELSNPEGCTITTASGGISAIAFSSADTPYGFPSDPARWRLEYIGKNQYSKTSGISTNIFYGFAGVSILAPIGLYVLSAKAYVQHTATPQQFLSHTMILTPSPDGTALNSVTGIGKLPASAFMGAGSSGGANVGQWDTSHILIPKPIALTSATPINLLVAALSGSGPALFVNGLVPNGDVYIALDNALL